MRILLLAVGLYFFSFSFSLGQEFNPERLREIAREQEALFQQRMDRIKTLAGPMGIPMKKELSENRTAYLVDVVDGVPYYLVTHNEEARLTTGVEFVQSPNGLNLPLFGDNITVAVFDEGTVRATHVELSNRVQNITTTSDFANHATHVTGTVVAKGINPSARGMLPNARVRAYYALGGNDLGPMATEAEQGLLLSNHSYGLLAGWEFNNGEWGWFGGADQRDQRFGYYSNKSRSIDDIAFNAPFYTIVWAAGNDRNDVGDGTRPPDGPYDCITPEGISKNAITIGAITGFEQYTNKDDAVMTNFSSWGPADDGRIKPDLVGDGLGVLSTGSGGDETYVTLQGTSMSSPNVTGSLGVVQQYYKQVTGDFMPSSLLKAISIHTAHEAGPGAGPDYMFGWGVMNTVGAIELIRDRNGQDTLAAYETLNNGQTKSYSLFSDGETPITATIAWTDRPGTVGDQGDTDIKLVNDLDIRLVDDEGNVVMPWILDPQSPGRSAQRGDNIRDNAEQLELLLPEPRKYTLVVSHKGNLVGGSQKYSVVITGNSIASGSGELYWISNTGGTSQGANWANVSGGSPLSQANLLNKTLVFDNNANLTAESVITLDASATISNLIWLNSENATLDLNGNTLQINGLISSSNNAVKISNGRLVLKATEFTMLNLDIDGSDNLEIVLDNSNPLEIGSDIKTSVLTIGGAAVTMNGSTISLDELNIESGSLLSVNGNEILVRNGFSNSGSLNDNNSIWVFENAILNSTGSTTLNSVTSNEGVRLNGQWTAAEWAQQGALTIGNRLSSGKFSLLNTDLVLLDNATLAISDELNISADVSDRSTISSIGGRGTVQIEFRDLLCYSNTDVENIDFDTESVVNFENGSLTSVTNAISISCEDVVFASFKTTGECANSPITIEDLSSGSIDTYLYDFGNGQTSTLREPIAVYDAAGQYLIKQTVANNVLQEDFQQTIQVIANNLPEISIIENTQGLVADVNASGYQWYRNNELIPGATNRLFTPELNGQYRVAYTRPGEGCEVRISAAYNAIVTSVEDELDPELINERISIYPNPAYDRLYISNAPYGTEIVVHGMDGRKINPSIEEDGSRLIIDIGVLPAGIYVLQINNKTITSTFRFFKK